jgi:uncharacterized protein YjbI with pentapeptide repeats
LRGANFEGAYLKGYSRGLLGALTNSATTCPDGTRGPCTGGLWELGKPSAETVTVRGCQILPKTQCPGGDLSGEKLPNANLTGANLAKANLTGTVLTGADLTDASMNDVRAEGSISSRPNSSAPS